MPKPKKPAAPKPTKEEIKARKDAEKAIKVLRDAKTSAEHKLD